MAAASTAIGSLGCQMIIRAPHTSSSKSTSCFTGGKLHKPDSLKGLPRSSLSARHCSPHQSERLLFCRRRTGESGRVGRRVLASIASEELDVIPAGGGYSAEQKDGIAVGGGEEDGVAAGGNHVEVVASEGGDVEGVHVGSSLSASSASDGEEPKGQSVEQMVDRAVNAAIVLAAGTAAVTKLLTIDHDYWHGWTLYEILRYLPQHNWIAYEEALKSNPVLAKMMISGIVYSLGDWIAQCYEGKPLFEFDRVRMFRSGLVGFTLHGSLSHYYYHFCEALFPFQDWWVVPAKVVFDQTAWSAIWNSIYYVVLGFLRFESPANILDELKSTFWPMLTAGWKLWPFAHLITYGVIPVEQRLLWVDCVELIWVTILSTYSNEKSEARNSETNNIANK